MRNVTAIIGMLILVLTGCSQGTRQWYEKSEPQTCIIIDPISKQVKVFTNEGRTLTLDKATITKNGDGYTFDVGNLVINEKSVENRVASATQDTAWFEGAAVMNKSILGEGGIAGIVREIVPAFNAWAASHPTSAKNPDIVQGVIQSLIKAQVSKTLATP